MRQFLYVGHRTAAAGSASVLLWAVDNGIGGLGRPLPPRNDVRDHSPDGFQWGYGGSGPAQLALALCIHACCALDNLGTSDSSDYGIRAKAAIVRAERAYQDVKLDLIATIKGDDFTLTSDEVLSAIERSEAKRAIGAGAPS